LTFEVALRSTLRQDPDVILVGEIRDVETAQIAFHAGLTGHLVLSTGHATEAVTALVRLSELGVDRGVVRSTLVGVAAQRLVRRNCVHCLEPDSPPPHLVERMSLPPGAGERFRRSRGCPECDFSGTRGRAPLFEILELNGELSGLLGKGREGDLRDAARATGFRSLATQAGECVLSGDISVEEAYRTCHLGERQ
jgi:type II secretory ATPase GspE/PulE/Tfp pilus assembly ATPase PilB-like protein